MMNGLKWGGTFFLVITAYLTSVNIYPLNITVGLVATTILGFVSIRQRDWQYTMVNGVFFCLNIYGLWRFYL